jgi:hypothetical protein
MESRSIIHALPSRSKERGMVLLHRAFSLSLAAAGGAALLIAAITPEPAPAAATTVACNPVKLRMIASDSPNVSTDLTTFKTLSEATVSFTQGGTAASCVVVRFSAESFVTSFNGIVFVRAFLDNTTAAVPGEVQFSGDDGNRYRAHSYDFIFPSVAPGAHVLRMQFRSGTGGDTVFIKRRTTIVQHAG